MTNYSEAAKLLGVDEAAVKAVASFWLKRFIYG